RVPQAVHRIDQTSNQQLMRERLMWMIQEWGESEVERRSAHSLLMGFVNQTEPAQITPELPEVLTDSVEIQMWTEEWTQAIVMGNSTLMENLVLEGFGKDVGPVFPVTSIDQTHLDYQEQLEAHNEMGLEEWLEGLTYLKV
ncbi:MAG: hypothetical protein AAGE92_12370, partial [Cyanobacteria bacterium P01_G01_bin.4]